MQILNSENTALLFIDFQARLMRVIDGADDVIANAKRLLDAAALLGVPTLSPRGSEEASAPRLRRSRRPPAPRSSPR